MPSSTYNPDSLWNYELGSKATLLGGRVTVDASLFPKPSVSASGEYRFPVAPGANGFAWAAYQHVGRRTTDFSSLPSRYRPMDWYDVVDARVGARHGPLEVSFYAKNLTDSGGVLRALASTPFDAEGEHRITPRTLGLTARYTY